MSGKKIKLTDAIVDDIALYLGREHLVPRTPGVITYPPRADTMDAWRIVSAVLSHPDAAGLFADVDDRPWEPLNGPVRVGDEVRREWRRSTRIAVVGRVDEDGDPWTAEGALIGILGLGTWCVRRPAIQELPTKCGTVIIANDGHECIEAEVSGVIWRTSEAILGLGGRWHGVWRAGQVAVGSTSADSITPGTWKVGNR